MLCSKCTLVAFHLVVLGTVVSSHSFKDILDTVDFSDAVVRFAKLWRTSHRDGNVSLSRADLQKLVERLQSVETFANRKDTVTTREHGDEKLSTDEVHRYHSKRARRHVDELSGTRDVLRRRNRDAAAAHAHVDIDIQRQKRTSTSDNGFIGEQPLDRRPLQDLEHPQRSRSSGDSSEGLSPCPACVLQDEAKRMRLEAIKKQILTKLRLSKPPNVSKFANVDSNPAILRLMGLSHSHVDPRGRPHEVIYTVDDDDSFFATPMRVIQIAENLPPAVTHFSNSTDSLCYFKFQQDLYRYRIHSAKLSIYIRRSRDHARRMTVILLHTITTTNGGKTLNTTLVKTMNLNLTQRGRWRTFDVKQEVADMTRSANNVTFKVEAFDHDGRPMAVTHPVSEEEKDKVPYLEIRLRDTRRRRPKRQYSRDCDATSREERCCRYPLLVDFEQFGWDFVRQPRTFNAYYCSGACEMNHNQHSTAHSHLVEQVVNNPYASSGPCCVASKLSARSILYRDDHGTYIYGIIPGMSVEKCGCA